MTIPTEIPNLVPKAPKPSITANWALFAGSILSAIIGVLSLTNPTLWDLGAVLSWMSDSGNPLPVATGFAALNVVVVPLLAIAASILGFVTRAPKIFVALTLANFLLLYVLDMIAELAWMSVAEREVGFNNWMDMLLPIFMRFSSFALAKFLFLFVTALAAIALFLKPRAPKPAFGQVQPLGAPVAPGVVPAPAAAPAPNYVAPAPGVPAMGAPSQLPIFALVAAFIVPLAGIIMGHISLNQMNKGQISSQNRTMAIAGLALGYVFMALGFLAGIILIVVILSNPYLFSSY